MDIQLVKFGTTLVFRERGREAFAAFEPALKNLPDAEKVVMDFAGVITFSPSWGDEFISPLFSAHGDRLILRNTSNPSVQATLEILGKTHSMKFNIEN
ncbi:MAG: STAS-like domain-containing protein [Candidatus Zambryskibacteria bacterium]|nr:STAS-like domain-containing protein [Candidatus Zambryskibacteria bacterium]